LCGYAGQVEERICDFGALLNIETHAMEVDIKEVETQRRERKIIVRGK
jgi:hypothetical protein